MRTEGRTSLSVPPLPVLFRPAAVGLGAWLLYLTVLNVARERFAFDQAGMLDRANMYLSFLVLAAVIAILWTLGERRPAAVEDETPHPERNAELLGAGFHLTARMQSSSESCNDFYELTVLEDGAVMVLLGDLSGDDLVSTRVAESAESVLQFHGCYGAEAVMRAMNSRLAAEPGCEPVPLLCARFDPATQTVSIANSGMPDPVIVSEQKIDSVQQRAHADLFATDDYVTAKVRLRADERLLMFSDLPETTGIAEDTATGTEDRTSRAARLEDAATVIEISPRPAF